MNQVNNPALLRRLFQLGCHYSGQILSYIKCWVSAQSGKSFQEAMSDRAFFGRLLESSVGAHLLNGIRGTQIELFYWSEGSMEVDFVLRLGDKIIALEVKSGQESLGHSASMHLSNNSTPIGSC